MVSVPLGLQSVLRSETIAQQCSGKLCCQACPRAGTCVWWQRGLPWKGKAPGSLLCCLKPSLSDFTDSSHLSLRNPWKPQECLLSVLSAGGRGCGSGRLGPQKSSHCPRCASSSTLQEADKHILQALLEKEDENQRMHLAKKEQALADAAWMKQVIEEQLQLEREREAELQLLLR